MMFVKSRIRKSLVAKMVGELLDTRVMVKSSMKAVEDDKVGTTGCAVASSSVAN